MAASRKPAQEPAAEGPRGRNIALKEAMEFYFSENTCLGEGDLRAGITVEMLQRKEIRETWTINHKTLTRADVMELMLDLVASGFSIPAILKLPGFPKPRTYLNWITEYAVFAEMMELSEKMSAMIMVDQALEIADSVDPDGKQAVRDRQRSDLRMRLAEVMHPRRYGKKSMVDVTHHTELDPEEQWSRFNSILTTHAQMIEAKTGIKIIFPEHPGALQTIDVTPEPESDPRTAGMEGENIPEDDFNIDLRF